MQVPQPETAADLTFPIDLSRHESMLQRRAPGSKL
jgi:hypothetical protein